MTGPIRILAADTVRTLFVRRTTVLLLMLIFALLTVVSCSLQLTGQTVVNGQASPFGDDARHRMAVAAAFGGAHALGVLLILFLLLPGFVGEIDSGLATWIVTKPLPRRTLLHGRLLGGLAFLAATTGFVVLGLEILLARYSGSIAPRAVLGWGILLLLLAGYMVWGILLALRLGAGFGGIALLLLAACGAVVDTDALTRLFLYPGGDGQPAGLLSVLLQSFFRGAEPPVVARLLYGASYVLLPGTGNVHDVAIAVALGTGIPIASDLVSVAILLAGLPLGLFLASRTLARREL